jgi:hypothetical protein
MTWSFICKGDAGTSEFKLSELTPAPPANFELIDAWDFGPDPTKKCSYSYHNPFPSSASTVSYALTTSSEPGFAVAADRNPWINSPAGQAKTPFGNFVPDVAGVTGSTTEKARFGNAISHQDDGQNVLFLDSHVQFEKRSYCSLEDDNVYTSSRYGATVDQKGDALGNAPVVTSLYPTCRKDTVLVHDDSSVTTPVGPGPRPRPSPSRP